MKRRRGMHIKPPCPYCGDPYKRRCRMVNINGVSEVYDHGDSFCWPHEADLKASVFATAEGLFANPEDD